METNPITAEIHAMREAIDHKDPVDLTDLRLARIVRLRLVSDPGFSYYDVSYCYGELRNGEPVRVDLPAYQFSKKNLNGELIAMCKAAKVYGKGLGLFDAGTISILT